MAPVAIVNTAYVSWVLNSSLAMSISTKGIIDNFYQKNYLIRLVNEVDAAFIIQLRTGDKYNKHLYSLAMTLRRSGRR